MGSAWSHLVEADSCFERLYTYVHGELFYKGGYKLPILGVRVFRLKERRDEHLFAISLLSSVLGLSLVPIVATQRLDLQRIFSSAMQINSRNASRLTSLVRTAAFLPMAELARFFYKWSYRAFGLGPVPWSVRRLLSGPGAKQPGETVRFVVISDTHCQHDALKLPRGDILIHCGDFTEKGTYEEVKAFNAWLGNQTGFRRRIVIAGNHDLGMDPNLDDVPFNEIIRFGRTLSEGVPEMTSADAKRESAEKFRELLTNCEYVEGAECKSERGIRIYGAPWTKTIGVSGYFHVPGAFNRNEEKVKRSFKPAKFVPGWITTEHKPVLPVAMTDAVESLEDAWKRVPVGIDILLTHMPPYGILDNSMGKHIGDKGLLKLVQRLKPKYHIFGHFHADYGVEKRGETVFVNASTETKLHDPWHAPVIFDVPVKD
mmetsp:Transcript_1654/g.3838  ORF Transcript_1654/g.3838 Transcript_1654/m.3838 type:complete len:429 (-) Transcript_1654:190-1476(-)